MLKNAQNRVFGGLEANYNQDSIFCPKGGGVAILSQLSNSVPCALCLFNLLGFHLTTLVCRHLCVCVSAEFAALAE